ncbi:uncharacterized protein [Procambarus clarkii]|uniref:uncharacterized protein isoform X2 n=1 Tax=Procambarus clarkii TaxID=6728 RepID=UPI003742C20F
MENISEQSRSDVQGRKMMIYVVVTLGSLTLLGRWQAFAVPISNENKSELYNLTFDDTPKMTVIPEPEVQKTLSRREQESLGRVVYYTKTMKEPLGPQSLSEEKQGSLVQVNTSKLLLINSTTITTQYSVIQQDQRSTQTTIYEEQFRLQDAKDHEQSSYTEVDSSMSQHVKGKYNEMQSNINATNQSKKNKYVTAHVYSIYDLLSGNHDIIEKKESSFLGGTENNSKTMGKFQVNENAIKTPAKEEQLSANTSDLVVYTSKAKKTHALGNDYKKITVLYNLYSLVAYVSNQEHEQINLKTKMNQHNDSIIENKNFNKMNALHVLYSLVSYVASLKYEQTEEPTNVNADKNHTSSGGRKVHDIGLLEEHKEGKRLKKRQNGHDDNSASFVAYISSDQFNNNDPNLDKLEGSLVKTEEPSLIREVKGYLKSYGWRGYLIISVTIVIGLIAILFLVGFIAKMCRWHKNHKQLTKLQHLIHPASI